jgi:hypothetical protein
MADELIVLGGSSFFVSRLSGDVDTQIAAERVGRCSTRTSGI